MRSPFLGFGSEEALRHIAGALSDAVFTTDAAGHVTYWNAAAQRITGWTADEAHGRRCSILAGDVETGCACGDGPVRCGLALNGRSSKQCTIRTRDGRLLSILKSAVPIRNAGGVVVGALESFTTTPVPPDTQDNGSHRAALVGRHPVMRELHRTIALVAGSDATVLVAGESGTGKDRVVEAIHRCSRRATNPLVRVPCSGIELLLDDRGAPVCGTTDSATPPHPFDGAIHGTLVLGELTDLSATGQLRLLRFLERREASAMSEDRPGPRLLCTTHSDLRALVDARRFRADLFFRLNVFPVRVPALREHLDDVPLIAEEYLRRRQPPAALTPQAATVLAAQRWPGNVRELQNALEFAALRAAGDPIAPTHLPCDTYDIPSPPAVDEREAMAEALLKCGGNRTLAARELGISRVTLWKRMKRYGVIEPADP